MQSHETNPSCYSCIFAGGWAAFVSSHELNLPAPLKRATGEENHASSETWNQTPRPPQKAAEARQGIFPYQGKALPFGERSGEPLAALYVSRPLRAQTRLPRVVDSAHRSRRAQ